MKKFFTLLTLCLLATTVWGETVITFTPGSPAGHNDTANAPDEMEKDGIKVATTVGAFNATQYRFAKNSVTTITSSVGKITKIEFTCTAKGTEKYGPGCFAAQDGYTFEPDGVKGTWIGSAETVTFTAESNQVRATEIVFTVSGDGISAPTISPAGGTFRDPVNVTITSSTEGAKIYYTLDDSEPTESSQQYTNAFTISENTVVKAIAAKDGKTSSVATARFNFSDEMFGLNDLFNTADNTNVTLTYNATVLWRSGINLYIKDATGYGLVYGEIAGKSYKQGDVIPGGYGGLKTTYNSMPEIKNPVGFNDVVGTEDVEAEVITPAQVAGPMWAHYVVIKDVMVTADGNNGTLTAENGETCPIFSGTFHTPVPDDLTVPYNVYGIVAAYQKGGQGDVIFQLLPTKFESEGGEDPVPVDVASIEELYTLVAKGKQAHFTTPLKTIHQSGSYLYVLDVEGTYGLVYGSLDATFTNGDLIKDAICCWTEFNGNKQITPIDNFVKNGESTIVKAEEIRIEDIQQSDIYKYFKITEVTIAEGSNDRTFVMTDPTGDMVLYNQFNNVVQVPVDGQEHTVWGFVTDYKGTVEFLPIAFDEDPYPESGNMRGDVDGNGEVNIADVNCVVGVILGKPDVYEGRADVDKNSEVNIADVNEIISIILYGPAQ